MKPARLTLLAAASFAAFGLAACGDHLGDNRTASQKVDNAVDKAGDKAREVVADVNKGAHEAAITASIKADLMKDPELSALKIDVDTSGSVVTLSGTAPTASAVDRAGRIAIAVSGVTEVRNHLVAG